MNESTLRATVFCVENASIPQGILAQDDAGIEAVRRDIKGRPGEVSSRQLQRLPGRRLGSPARVSATVGSPRDWRRKLLSESEQGSRLHGAGTQIR